MNTLKNPYLNQASQTEKYLPKFSYPKNPEIENFKPQKILRSSLSLEIRSTHPWTQKATLVFQTRPTALGPCSDSGLRYEVREHPLAVFFLSAHISFPTKKKKCTCFTACQYLVGVYKRNRLQNRSQFLFALFTPSLRSGLEARDTRNAWRTSYAGYKRN